MCFGLCGKCSRGCSWLVLVLAIGFLLADLGYWSFWGLNWWTILFLLVGFGAVCSSYCKGCQSCGECCEMPTTKKKQ